jgi:hypothetical protein
MSYTTSFAPEKRGPAHLDLLGKTRLQRTKSVLGATLPISLPLSVRRFRVFKEKSRFCSRSSLGLVVRCLLNRYHGYRQAHFADGGWGYSFGTLFRTGCFGSCCASILGGNDRLTSGLRSVKSFCNPFLVLGHPGTLRRMKRHRPTQPIAATSSVAAAVSTSLGMEVATRSSRLFSNIFRLCSVVALNHNSSV